MNAWNERECDSENFGAQITGIGSTVEKIWLFEILGARLQFWKVSKAIFVNTECVEGFCAKIQG
jgi:hypothetical protein